MSERRLVEALNDCIDRLASGQTLDECLRAYPDMADELRPLLILGQLPRRAHADPSEVTAMRTRLDSRIETMIASSEISGSHGRLSPGVVVLLVALLIVFVVGFALQTQRTDRNMAADPETTPTPAQSNPPPEATEEASVTQEVRSTPSSTASPTNTPIEHEVEATSQRLPDSDSTSTPGVTAEEAIATALTIFPNGTVSNIDLETWEDGRLVWDIELDEDRRGVDIDAMRGTVLFFGYEVNDNNRYTGDEAATLDDEGDIGDGESGASQGSEPESSEHESSEPEGSE